ncbi:MAG TPA: ABC transporter ATP-binding protein [Bacteroidia bacterium]|jgi:iron complex transport system ATP-binding protein|nr:ABC transporter ATP-binding protein [Bacteroidia bacterium]
MIPGDNPNIFQTQNYSVGYEEPVLQNISLKFSSPGVVGIIGNNGKGKTTLLKSLCGLLKPSGGKIIFNDTDIYSVTNGERAKLISLNFSSNNISFPISVYELVSMGRYPYTNHWAGLSQNDKKIIDEALELCQVKNFKDKFITGLSDGEKQKVFIAKLIAQQTPIMLFDEPTAFLDYSSKKYYFQLMKKIATEQQKIILISSHDIDFLTAYTDELVMIEDDETVVCGTTNEIMKSDYFKKHFTKL